MAPRSRKWVARSGFHFPAPPLRSGMERNSENKARLLAIWKFVRCDTEPDAFAEWVYGEPALEAQLGEALHLQLLIGDYTNKATVYDLREILAAFAREASGPMACECVARPSLVDADMGDEVEAVLRTMDKRALRGEPHWWLAAYQCRECGEWWLLAQESRINDVYFLKRLSAQQGEAIAKEGRWPTDFDRYETLLRLGRERGHRVRYVEPLDSSELLYTTIDLAKERPGIRVSELAELLNLEGSVAKLIAKKATAEQRVAIDVDK